MRESTAPRLVGWLGRLLPPSRRELVFEPLCEELWRNALAAGSTLGARLRFQACLLEAFLATALTSTPRYFMERGHVTALSRVVLAVALALVLAAWVQLVPWIMTLVTQIRA